MDTPGKRRGAGAGGRTGHQKPDSFTHPSTWSAYRRWDAVTKKPQTPRRHLGAGNPRKRRRVFPGVCFFPVFPLSKERPAPPRSPARHRPRRGLRGPRSPSRRFTASRQRSKRFARLRRESSRPARRASADVPAFTPPAIGGFTAAAGRASRHLTRSLPRRRGWTRTASSSSSSSIPSWLLPSFGKLPACRAAAPTPACKNFVCVRVFFLLLVANVVFYKSLKL